MADSVIMIAGQSNGLQVCGLAVAGVGPAAGCYVFTGAYWRAMTSSDGAGMIELANDLRANGYANVYVYDCSYGGASVVPEAASPPTNCWQYPNPPILDCLAQVAAGGKIPQFVIWVQGEAEVIYSAFYPSFDMVNTYQARLDQVRAFLLGRWGVTTAQCAWMITPVGKVSTFSSQPVVLSQQQYANSTPGVFFGPPRDDLATLDGIHLTGPSCRTFGDRLAPILLAYIQEQEAMTDPQDKAAIASLQSAVTGIQAGITSLQAGVTSLLASAADLKSNVATLQQNIGSLNHRTVTLESLAPSLTKWSQPWPQAW